MNRRNLYKAVFTIASVIVLAIGGFGQGRGHGGGNPHGGGGGGNPHGGGGGGGQPQLQVQQPPQQRGGGNPHGNGGGNPHWNGGGGQQRQVWAQQMQQQRAVQMQQQRAIQQQRVFQRRAAPPQWQQQRAVQQPQRTDQRQQWRALQQQQRVLQQQVQRNDQAARMQQRQNDQNFRNQQRMNPQFQQRGNPQVWRQQQSSLRQQFEHGYVPPQQTDHGWTGHDNGLHRGWTDNGPRGNAYGLRGMAPGQNGGFNNWNSFQGQPNWQGRGGGGRNRNGATTYYNYDPLAVWAPQIYRYNNYNSYSSYPYDNYGYNYPAYYTYGQPQDVFIRTMISSFFVPDDYYYTTFYTPPYYDNPYYDSGYYGYAPDYYYSNVGYGPSYYDSGYYDPYYYDYYYEGVPMFASPFYGDNSLKSSLLYFGVRLLQGFLGQGYVQGLSDAEYVRVVQGPVYYDPYQAPEPAYYSPYVSSFADQRQIFEDGYRMGYEDAMRNQDPYAVYNNGARVDIVSQFLANSFCGS